MFTSFIPAILDAARGADRLWASAEYIMILSIVRCYGQAVAARHQWRSLTRRHPICSRTLVPTTICSALRIRPLSFFLLPLIGRSTHVAISLRGGAVQLGCCRVCEVEFCHRHGSNPDLLPVPFSRTLGGAIAFGFWNFCKSTPLDHAGGECCSAR